MDGLDKASDNSAESLLPRPYRLVRRLLWLYGVTTLAVALLLCAAALPPAVLPQTRALAREMISGGLAALLLATLLLALTGLAATLLLTVARARHAAAAAAGALPPPSARRRWTLADPGFAARQGQAIVVPLGALAIWLVTRLLWPAPAQSPVISAASGVAISSATIEIAAAFVFAIAFVSLVAERVLSAFPAPQLPEAPTLRRVLLLVTVVLTAAACIQIGRSAGLAWVRWPQIVILWVPALVVLELALRALARLFLPPPAAADARAVADSVLVGLITGGPRAPGTLLRTHFGLDFARSWALAFLSTAILPALFGTALLCWGLSGLKLIDLAHRGVYERFGAPVAVLGPGLHLLLPWPMGRLRLVEYGAIHSIPIGVGPGDEDTGAQTPDTGGTGASDQQLNAALANIAQQYQVSVGELPSVFAAEGVDYTHYRDDLRRELASEASGAQPAHIVPPPRLVPAEATPPLSLNRLWETVHADQAHYLVASLGTGEQGFQSVDTEIYVLYRVGLTDRAALQSIYTVTDPAALVRESASRLVLRFFNSRTLEQVLGAQRENVAGMLRDELAANIASYHAGIDIVSVLIEEIHPPAGAAEAYHAVQAAEINANASISDELGRAKRTAGVAQQEAHQLLTAADAAAVETRAAASSVAYRFGIDRRAYQQDGRAFLLERLYGNLTSALQGRTLTIMDQRLSTTEGPIIDMRPAGAAGGAAGVVSLPGTATSAGGSSATPIELEPAFTDAD